MELDSHVLLEPLNELGQEEGLLMGAAGEAEAPGLNKMVEAQQRAVDGVAGQEKGE